MISKEWPIKAIWFQRFCAKREMRHLPKAAQCPLKLSIRRLHCISILWPLIVTEQ